VFGLIVRRQWIGIAIIYQVEGVSTHWVSKNKMS